MKANYKIISANPHLFLRQNLKPHSLFRISSSESRQSPLWNKAQIRKAVFTKGSTFHVIIFQIPNGIIQDTPAVLRVLVHFKVYREWQENILSIPASKQHKPFSKLRYSIIDGIQSSSTVLYPNLSNSKNITSNPVLKGCFFIMKKQGRISSSIRIKSISKLPLGSLSPSRLPAVENG